MRLHSGIVVLEHDEDVRLDPGCVAALYRDLGPLGAENVVNRAMSEIATRHAALQDPYRAGQWADLARQARGLSAIAEQMGMGAVARVARDVAECAITGDAAGLGATLQRLDRLALRSLAEMWGISGIGA